MQDANSVLIRYIVNVHLKAHGEIRHGGVIEKKRPNISNVKM